MQALVYNGPGKKNLEDRPKPTIKCPTDAVVRITKTTICGTDLHILKGDVATCQPGTVLGHEGVGVVDAVGAGVTSFQAGRPGADLLHHRLRPLRRLPQGHVLALHDRRLDARQHASTARRPSSCAFPMPTPACTRFPQGADEEALVMLSDILPTGFECGVLNGKVAAGIQRRDRRLGADRAGGACSRRSSIRRPRSS